MKSKTSSFNKTIFSNLYKRFWPVFAAYLGIWLIILPVALQNTLRFAAQRAESLTDGRMLDISLQAAQQVMKISFFGGITLSGIFALFIAMAAFSYLYNSKSVSMMCALPIKREGVFTAVTLAGLGGLLVSNLVVFLITAAVETSFGALGLGYILQGLAMVCLLNLFFFGFAALCASFTGHVLVLPAVYIVLNFTVSAVELFSRIVLRIFLYGFDNVNVNKFAFLSPVVGLVGKTGIESEGINLPDGSFEVTGYSYSGWTQLIIYGLVGLAFLACAMLLIKHRRMETAGDVVAVKPLKPIFKYCMCVGCALLLGAGIYYGVFDGSGYDAISGLESMLYMLLFMLIGGFVGYFAADMLMKKTLRVFSAKNWCGFVITAVIIAALVVCTELDFFGYERHIPEVDEIEEVSINGGEFVILKEPENLEAVRALHSDMIANKELYEQAARNVDYNYDAYSLDILYTLKNGKAVDRSYMLYTQATNDVYTLTDILNSNEGVQFRKQLSVAVEPGNIAYSSVSYFNEDDESYQSIELTPLQAAQLYNDCIAPDIDERRLGRVWLVTDDSYLEAVYSCNISIELRQRYVNEHGTTQYRNDYFSTTLTTDAVRTKQWITDNLGIEPITEKKTDEINARNMTPDEYEKYGYEYASRDVVYYK